MPEIHSTTDYFVDIAHRIGNVQQSLCGTKSTKLSRTMADELQGVVDDLWKRIDFASNAEGERKRREDEYEKTGTITVPLGQPAEELIKTAINEVAARLGLDPADITAKSSEMQVCFRLDVDQAAE